MQLSSSLQDLILAGADYAPVISEDLFLQLGRQSSGCMPQMVSSLTMLFAQTGGVKGEKWLFSFARVCKMKEGSIKLPSQRPDGNTIYLQ